MSEISDISLFDEYKEDNRGEVKAMPRDQVELSSDAETLDDALMADLNYETVKAYRNRHKLLHSDYAFEQLSDEEYLRSIGAVAISKIDKELHPTVAGMLMFGVEYNIVRHFPEYFLDYHETLDATIRWTDRLQSNSGDWSGNLFDFYFRVISKLVKDFKIPFKIIEGTRIDNTPMHDAVREALANCLINTDYYISGGIVIKKNLDSLVFENPGYIRTGKKQMRLGGVSDPRNKSLMKMFNMINIGERAGSGVPNIIKIWGEEGLPDPIIEEQFNPDRTILILPLEKRESPFVIGKSVIGGNDTIGESSSYAKDSDRIVELIRLKGSAKRKDIENELDISSATVKRRINELISSGLIVKSSGGRYTTYEINKSETK